MKFEKWHGLGNDFVIVNIDSNNNFDFSKIAQQICDRHCGIGADGLVTIQQLGDKCFRMRIYNSDGSECEMCGNATRCIGNYLRLKGLCVGDEIELMTGAGKIRPCLLDGDLVKVDMGEPKIGEQNVELQSFVGNNVSMGNPHFVIFIEQIQAISLEKCGPKLETDPFFPKKSNIEFVQILTKDKVRMRVWERGCGITQACGTGSCATAVACVLHEKTNRQVTVVLDGGELKIEWSQDNNHVYMTGPACRVFTGEYDV